VTLKTSRLSADGKYVHTTYHTGTPGMEIYDQQLRRAMEMDVANDEHLKTMEDEPPKRGRADGTVIEVPKQDEVLVTYPDTLDGFLAAWVVRRIAQTKNIAIEMCKGAPAPDIDLTGRNWIMIGDIVSPDELSSSPKSILHIDTHKDGRVSASPMPFKDWVRTFPFGIKTMAKIGGLGCESGTSLCKAAWDFFYADRKGFDKIPRILDYVDDSLTENRYGDTADVVACVDSYPRDWRTFDSLVEAGDDRKRLAYIVAGGQAIRRYVEKCRNLPF
jgi:hypothetical protein